jgi:beta-glucanase (GH16 family)
MILMKRIKFYQFLAILAFGLFLSACKKSEDPTPPAAIIPELTIEDAVLERKTSDEIMRFYIYGTKATTNDVTIDYKLIDGTATAPKDYTASQGTITVPANETWTYLDVPIKGDPSNLRETNLQFTLQLSNPKLCTITTTSVKGIIITENGSYLPTDNTGYSTPETYPGYTLVWSDEFSGTTFDATAWNQEIGNNNGNNHELQYYTNSPKNTFVSEGNLIIEARNESYSGFDYTSGRMNTQSKKAFKYGRIDIRAKLPVGKGIWPALWMLGTNISSVSWPACGEIDIMELVGTYPGRVFSTLHWRNAAGAHASYGLNYNLTSGDFSQQFHVFSIIWTQDNIKSYVDDNLYFTMTTKDIPAFNAEQFFIFNVAVGGDWPGSPDASTTFPQRMFVDYVRMFQ